MKILKAVLVMIALILATASAYAIDIAPTVQITSNPSLTTESTATVTVIATDILDNAGIYQIKFYVNNALEYTKDCAYSTTCTLTRTRINSQPTQEFYYATATDRGNNTGTSSTINLTFLGTNTPPTFGPLLNKTILEDSGMHFNLTDLWKYANDSWTPVQNMTYYIVSQSNTSLANCMIDNNRYLNCTTVDANATGNSNITLGVNDSRFMTPASFWLTVQNVNDAPELILPIPAQSVNEDQSNLTINITQYFADIDGPAITYSFITNNSALNANVLQNGLLNLTGIDNKHGTFPLTIIASDDELKVNTTINVVINSINDAPLFLYNLENKTTIQDLLFTYQLNHTDIDGDTITYTDDSALFVINSATGLISFTPSTSGNYTVTITITDSGTPALQTSQVFNLEVVYIPRPGFENSTRNATYTETDDYDIYVTIIENAEIDKVLFELNGQNITAEQASGNRYKINLTGLRAGSYYHKWHANYTNGLSNTSQIYNFTIYPADAGLNIALNTPVVYGTNAEVNCTVQTQQGGRTLTTNTQVPPWPTYYDTTNWPAGMYNFTCTFGGTSNYTTANVLRFLNITKAPVTISVIAPDSVPYSQPTNATCNISVALGPSMYRNGTFQTHPDTTLLSAGTYEYTCAIANQSNYQDTSDTKFVTVQKALPVINLTVNGTINDIVIELPGMILNVNGTITTPVGGNIQIYINNTLQAGTNIAHNFTANVPVKLVYNGTENYSYSEKTIDVYVGSVLIKTEITPATGTHLNQSSTVISLHTNRNAQCRWGTSDVDFNSMSNNLSTTNGYNHTGTITGLVLGTNAVYLACTNDTAGTNEDLSYTVDNIIEPTFSLINGATATNSILYSTTVDGNSALNLVNATNSVINGSILTNCLVVNSVVKNYIGSNCYIADSIVDPPNTLNDLNNSIIGSSQIYHSNVTYSIVNLSMIYDSNINNSEMYAAHLINITMTDSYLDDVDSIESNITASYINQSALYYSNVIRTNATDTSELFISTVLDSIIIDSGLMYSTVINSTITNSDTSLFTADVGVSNSTITDSIIDSSTVHLSNVSNSTIYNSTLHGHNVTDANITNDVIYSGVITHGTWVYNATEQGSANISDVINEKPTAEFTPSSTATNTGTVIQFFSQSTDTNIGGRLNDSLTYNWTFGDGTSSTARDPSVIYLTAGSYNVTLTVTDKYGETDTVTHGTFEISASPSGTPATSTSSSSGGGGGGGGGGLAAMARTYEYDLESGMFFQRGLTMYDTLNIKYGGKTYTYKVIEIKRAEYAVVSINNVPYKFMDKEIKKVDLDGNHYYDVEISFINNYVTRAEFRMKPVHEMVPGYNPNAPATITPKPGQSSIIDKMQEAQKQLEQEKEEEKETEQEETEKETGETEEGLNLLSSAAGLAKTLISSMKGTITGAVTAGERIDEKGGATGTIITILVVVLGLLGYWAYNRFLD